MSAATLPRQEKQRLAALYSYDILDTAFDAVFDNIADIARWLTNSPIGLISLVDKDRQWFKSNRGLDVRETPRSFAFCAHAILGSGVFVVPDAAKDRRFAHNPLVTGPPHIRFYAGAPIKNPEGFALGALCVMDSKPRELSAGEEMGIAALGRITASALELHRSVSRMRGQLEELAQSGLAGRFAAELLVKPVMYFWEQMSSLPKKFSLGGDAATSTHGPAHGLILAELEEQTLLLSELALQFSKVLTSISKPQTNGAGNGQALDGYIPNLAPHHLQGMVLRKAQNTAGDAAQQLQATAARLAKEEADHTAEVKAAREAEEEALRLAKATADLETKLRSGRITLEEAERLEELAQYHLLDTPPEPEFNSIVELARTIFNAPMACISLLDDEREWYKACAGVEVAQIQRADSFCRFTIEEDELLVISDARSDIRFSANRLVIEEPRVRFYAGVPLRSCNGHDLGALCIMSTYVKTQFSDQDRENLQLLARMATSEMELRRLFKPQPGDAKDKVMIKRSSLTFGNPEGFMDLIEEVNSLEISAEMLNVIAISAWNEHTQSRILLANALRALRSRTSTHDYQALLAKLPGFMV